MIETLQMGRRKSENNVVSDGLLLLPQLLFQHPYIYKLYIYILSPLSL
jgi:hypothetical protein